MKDWDRDNPLARMPDETVKAHAALLAYAELGESRSHVKLAAAFGKTAGYVRQYERWSSAYSWGDRVAAWEDGRRDRAVAELDALWIQRKKEQREKEWALSSALIKKAEEMLTFPLASVQRQESRRVSDDGKTTIEQYTTINPTRWSMRDAATIVDTAAKLARLAAGLETDRQALDVGLTRDDLSKLSDEDLARLASAVGLAPE